MRSEQEIRSRMERKREFDPVCEHGRGAKKAAIRQLEWVLEVEDGRE